MSNYQGGGSGSYGADANKVNRYGGSGGGRGGRNYERLRQAGFSDGEIDASRKKLADIVNEFDSKARLSEQVEEVLLELSTKFVEGAAEYGCKLAAHRGSNSLQLDDLKLYMEGVLGIHVPGFGSTNTSSASDFSNSVGKGVSGRMTEDHTARLRLKRKAHVIMQENLFVGK
uniref:Transcription initiation factor TFIID subunit 12 domain-containing protein n=1 Tax=Mucochytrium quahogii TaxID=96639 RepID=A0A7S2RUT8_9STRA|mmetsp:Transcript_18741/g.30611  ORF Transcript_18741/g.30611 Transcript_18741/m.30611 type:complete len:172 (+) Transcript_18741:98-613(+)